MRSLSLTGNRLTTLPSNFSSLKELRRLFIRNNTFANVASIITILKSLPNLKELSISIKTNDEAQLIINTLEGLEILNGEKIEGSDDEESDGGKNDEQKDMILKLSLEELTEAAKIYDLIRVVKKPDKLGDDTNLSKLFEAQMTIVAKELRGKLTTTLPDDIKKAMILKAKHVLANTAFNKMIDIFAGKKDVADIWNKINKMYGDIFESFVGLLINIISADFDSSEQAMKDRLKLAEKLKSNTSKKSESKDKESKQNNESIKNIKEKDKIIAELTVKLKEAEAKSQELTYKLEDTSKELEEYKEAVNDEIHKANESNKNKIESLNSAVENLDSQFRTERKENLLLQKGNDELLMQIASLEEENRKYLEKIIRHSKDIGSSSSSFLGPESADQIHNVVPKQSQGQGKNPVIQQFTPQKLKELVLDICNQKRKFDEKCISLKQPKPTMEQYMYIYLEEKYGSKKLSIRWAEALVSGVRKYSKIDSDISLFGKILQNSCDEEYRLVHLEVKATIVNILSAELRKKYPSKTNDSMTKLFKEIQKGVIEEWAWKQIIKKMYNEEDIKELLIKIEEKFQDRRKSQILFMDFLKVNNYFIIDCT